VASAEREPITGVWDRSPQWGLGAMPLEGESIVRFAEVQMGLKFIHFYRATLY